MPRCEDRTANVWLETIKTNAGVTLPHWRRQQNHKASLCLSSLSWIRVPCMLFVLVSLDHGLTFEFLNAGVGLDGDGCFV
jgi:hypothetical protein